MEGLKDVQIWGKLYYVNDSAATIDHNWHIHDVQVNTHRWTDTHLGNTAVSSPHTVPRVVALERLWNDI